MYETDESIFEGLEVPSAAYIEGYENMFLEVPKFEKQLVIDSILMECAELSLHHTDIAFMKKAIKWWSSRNFYVWQRLFETMFFKYNPIWNKDGIIKDETAHVLGGQTEVHTGGSNTVTNESSYDDTNTNKITGFDSDALKVHDENHSEGWNHGETTTRPDLTSTTTQSGTNTDITTRTEAGNIGVTMTQDMIKAQREIVQFSIVDVIVQSFKEQFCILVY